MLCKLVEHHATQHKLWSQRSFLQGDSDWTSSSLSVWQPQPETARMMFGVVNNNCEAIIKVAVGRVGSPKIIVDAVIDTGFTSFLSLPLSTITELSLPWYYRDVGTLGDGSEVVFEIYKASVIWDGQNQIVDVAASDAVPLVGMGLLYGFKLQIEVVEAGRVTIETLK